MGIPFILKAGIYPSFSCPHSARRGVEFLFHMQGPADVKNIAAPLSCAEAREKAKGHLEPKRITVQTS